MRKQIAAANWKMNLTLPEAKELLNQLSTENIQLSADQQVIIAVPFPYLFLGEQIIGKKEGHFIAAQNFHEEDFGAFTGEVNAAMLASCGVDYVIIGHSERRKYFGESNELLARKVSKAIAHELAPIFCCGESLDIREANEQNDFVKKQIEDSLFHLDADDIKKVVVAYEPIWAIGTGKTASSEQAQEMHRNIREILSGKFGKAVADEISILYGGSVKPANAAELFAQEDVDGGLVGGASLKADQFIDIIRSLKKL